jgi:hypothetical protein
MEGKWRRLEAVGPCQRSRQMQDNSVKSLFSLKLEILVDVIGSESRNPRCARSWRPVSLLVLSTRLEGLYMVVEQVYQ